MAEGDLNGTAHVNLRSYRDDATSVSLEDSETAGIIDASDASDDEFFRDGERRFLDYLKSTRLKNASAAIYAWMKGPVPPRKWKIRPLFPAVQYAPIKLLRRFFPEQRHRFWLLVVFYIAWVAAFASVLHKSAFTSDVPGYGSPTRVNCFDRFWRDGNGCGLNGDLCRPFDNNTFIFRCPANCKRVQVVNPHAVGDEEVNYRPLVIGGSEDEDTDLSENRYRGDSFICGAAIHAGFVSDRDGGCGVVALTGEAQNFPSSKHHGISSVGFRSYFPMSFTFIPGTATQCRDLRWGVFGVSLPFTILLSIFTTSPLVFFWSEFVGIFFHVALASDPPAMTNYYAIMSTALGRFLPAAFCAFVVYKYCARPALKDLHAQFEKTILWLGACWVGAFNNYTFDKIPIERLTPHDIKQQPGAVPALIIVVLSIFFIALGQAWGLRIEGKMPQYLALYCTMGGCILLLVAVPKMNVRIHHYILALLLLPGTAMQNRPSILYQGLLVGLFINGIARWGFDSILQTPFELRGDARLGTLLPMVLPPIIHNNVGTGILANISFEWALPLPKHYDGMSVLVNDVERFRGYEDQGKKSFTWVRKAADLPEFFRFAYMSGNGVADYTKAGVWNEDGSWTHMKSGAS